MIIYNINNEYDWVLVYYYENDILVLTLFDTGNHASVLGL